MILVNMCFGVESTSTAQQYSRDGRVVFNGPSKEYGLCDTGAA